MSFPEGRPSGLSTLTAGLLVPRMWCPMSSASPPEVAPSPKCKPQIGPSPALLATRVQAIVRPICVVGRLHFQSLDHTHHNRTKGVISPLPGRWSRTENEGT